MEPQIELSIVIPAYKEEKRIHKILEAIEKYQDTVDFAIETIVVVDGSPDQTASVAKSFENRVRNLKIIDRKENHGKGYTVKEGVMAANGKYILFSDADNSTPIVQVNKLLEHTKNNEVIIGSRYCKGGKLAQPQPLQRRIGSRVLNMIIQAVAISGIRDTQCGFKLFENKAGKEIFDKITLERWSFDIEVLVIAKHMGYHILEVGITWYDDPHSQVNPIKDGLRMIKDSLQIRKNLKNGLYDRLQ